MSGGGQPEEAAELQVARNMKRIKALGSCRLVEVAAAAMFAHACLLQVCVCVCVYVYAHVYMYVRITPANCRTATRPPPPPPNSSAAAACTRSALFFLC